MASPSPQLIASGVLLLMCSLLAAATWSDLRHRRIPNVLVFAGTACALLLQSALPQGNGFASMLPGALGLSAALKGMGLALLLLLPLYAMGALGAGDVKLMAMVGAFLGAEMTLVCIVLTMAAGGFLIIGVTLHNGSINSMFANVRIMAVNSMHAVIEGRIPSFKHAPKSAGRVPYAVAITCGTLACLSFVKLGYSDWLGL
jgi:prepilin peptidase CpaA